MSNGIQENHHQLEQDSSAREDVVMTDTTTAVVEATAESVSTDATASAPVTAPATASPSIIEEVKAGIRAEGSPSSAISQQNSQKGTKDSVTTGSINVCEGPVTNGHIVNGHSTSGTVDPSTTAMTTTTALAPISSAAPPAPTSDAHNHSNGQKDPATDSETKLGRRSDARREDRGSGPGRDGRHTSSQQQQQRQNHHDSDHPPHHQRRESTSRSGRNNHSSSRNASSPSGRNHDTRKERGADGDVRRQGAAGSSSLNDSKAGASKGGRDHGRDSQNNNGRANGSSQQQHQDQPSQQQQHQDQHQPPRDHQDKEKETEKDKDRSKNKKEAEKVAPILVKPDAYSLLSITGRVGALNPEKSFFGHSRFVDEFEKLNKVGEGTYGVVYRAKDKRTNGIVALKRIRMERENDGLPISSLREIKLLKTLRHDNIVLVKEVAVGGDLDQIFLVMEYCEHDLAAIMDNTKRGYAPAEVKCLMYQLFKGMDYCHDHYVVHRDLKLSNLLINSQGILKIADFGLARSFGTPSRPMTPKVVTLWYRAPELLFGDSNYTTAVDMWSAGCIFGELLGHAPLLPGKVEKQQVDLIIDLLGTPHEKIWQGFNKLPMAGIKLPEQRISNLKKKFPRITDAALSLLSGLLTYDPKKRLSVKQALAHPYFIEAPPAKHPSLMPTFPESRNFKNEHGRENDAELKRQAPVEDTDSIGSHRKRMR